ncbi:hypothetical protein [Bradyrhizobium genosp. A]|uniref:hypothetical protein n=1 Tax=Bradyrhizobium genosp. A TaxID=83626 RepID=UPI003CE6D878
MARMRRYKDTVPGYRDGGRVPIPADTVESEQAALGSTDELRPGPPSAVEDDAVARALNGQLRAEELQRQAAQQSQQPMTVEQFVNQLPNLSDHKRAFLKSNPEMLNSDQSKLMRQAYNEALQAGFQDDTPELDRYMVDAVRAEMDVRRARLAESARSAASTMTQPPRHFDSQVDHQARLNAEVSSLQSAYNAQASAPDVLAAQLPEPALTPRTRSMPMTAPVSREVPMLSGKRTADLSKVTLSAEERFVAQNSFSSDLSVAERERLYATNKARLARERAEGRYPQPERN